jgi:alcohol dehydrogenase/propanol-preferring alcohol dehydrogenase
MRAWAVVENGQPLKEIELPTPEPTGTEVLLEVTHCGVCHSDLHIWEGYYDLGGGQKMSLVDRGVTLPLAMGHEIIGRVVKLGPDAKGVKVGDVRIVYPWLGCGKCEKCLSEEDNMCTVAARSLGVYQNGGYGTHVVAPHPRHLVDLGTLDPAVAATYAAPASPSIPPSRRPCRCPAAAHRAGRRRRAGPECDRRPESAEAPEHHQRRRQRRKT